MSVPLIRSKDGLIWPVILEDVPEDAPAVTEETFGPTLTIARVRDADEGVDRANASRYGLGGSVFGKAPRDRAGAADALAA